MANVDPKIQAAFDAEVKKTNMSMEAQREIQDALNAGVVQNIEHLKNLVQVTSNVAKKLGDVSKELTDQEKLAKSIGTEEYKLINIVSILGDKLKGNLAKFQGIGKASRDASKSLIISYKAQLKSGKLTKSAYKELVASAMETARIAQNMETIAGSSLAAPFDQAIDLADEMSGKIKGIFEAVPGGSYLYQALGGDELNDQLKGAVTKGFSAMASAMAAGATPLQALQKGMMAFNAAVAMNPMLLVVIAIAAAAAALAILVGMASKHEEEARKLSETMGTTVGQSKQLILQAKQATGAMGNQLSMAEDILAVQQESAVAFGTMAMLSTDQAASVSEIGKSFGYSAQQAGKVNVAFMAMGVSANEAANTQRDLAAEAMKAGVNVGAVTADIAENSKATSKYFGGNVKALKKAAIEAAKMGVSLATMAKVSDSLLDFESSISAQFELQALTGKQMNFDKARQLALEGNIAGATAEVLAQVGSIAEFNAMDVLERKKLAEATGMDVDELQKSLTIKSKLGDLTSEELASMNALGLSAAQMASMSSEDLQAKLAGQQSSEKMAAGMAAMKNQLMTALLPLGEAFMGVFAALTPILKVIGGVFSLIGAAIKGFLAPMTFVYGIITSIKDAISGVLETFGFLAPVVAVLGFAFDAIKNTVMIVGAVLGTVFLPNIIAAGVGAIGAAGGFIAAAIPAIFSAFGMIPFGLGIPLAIAAVAGMIGTTMSYMSDGVVSPQTGGSGFGSRTLFGPEGAISFNNKDTIVAGTNLFGQANDAVFAPPGAMKMNDGAVGDIPDPPEAKIVGIGAGSVAKLSMGIAAAIGIGMVPAMIAGFTAFTPVLGAMLMTTLPMIGIATAVATMPMTVAAITAGMIAGALAAAVATIPLMVTAITAGFAAALMVGMPIISYTIVGAIMAASALQMPILAATIVGAVVSGALVTALIPKPVMILNPVLPTFETNPVMMMGSMLGGIGNLLGGGKASDKEDPVIAKLDQVIRAIENMEINMDGEKVGMLTRLADTFRRG